MATKIETLKKPNGDHVLPRTRAKAVSMEDGTSVEAAITSIEGVYETKVDAIARLNEAKSYVDEAMAGKSTVKITFWEEGD